VTSRKPTILDVARRAAVAVGTVSHVLNDSRVVSEARRERVLRAIDELGYLPDGLAQGLRRKQSHVVGLCVPHTTSAYLGALFDTFEEIASDRGYELMQVLSRNDPATELRRVKALLRHRIGGMILVPSLRPEATLALLHAAGVPTVVADRPSDDARFDQVSIDNRSAMLEAAQRLIALGHRRLLFVARYPRLVVTRHRIEGLKRACREARRPVHLDVLEFAEGGAAFTTQLAAALRGKAPPTAVIASNSTIAVALIRALRDLSVKCPRQVSLLAFDEPEWADLVTPELAIVRHPTREIARRAWELLINRMTGKSGATQRIELPAHVELRRSVAPPPASTGRSRAGD
jgi:LacI family transcriptional regulator